ncbi:MAG TPA: ribonuclease P protein component [Candidatus Eisenbacteria bacterium]|nr:ribonuclease P protein component [Candidatus Eisenbacteria bacterium]
MPADRRERLTHDHRLTTSRHYAEVKEHGVAMRGRHCLLVVLPKAGDATRFGFIASKRGVGGAVQRNRARRRLREIVRRRWPRIPEHGFWIVVIASKGALTAPHEQLASELERLLASAGALLPIHLPADAPPAVAQTPQ